MTDSTKDRALADELERHRARGEESIKAGVMPYACDGVSKFIWACWRHRDAILTALRRPDDSARCEHDWRYSESVAPDPADLGESGPVVAITIPLSELKPDQREYLERIFARIGQYDPHAVIGEPTKSDDS